MKNILLNIFSLLCVGNAFGQINERHTIKLRDTTIDDRLFVKGIFNDAEFLIHKKEFQFWGNREYFSFKVTKLGQISQSDSLNNRLNYKLSDTIRHTAKQMLVEKIDDKMCHLVVQILPNTEGPKYGYRIGEIIEEMNFMTINNTVFNNRGKKGTFILYNFWATWCYPCVKNMPTLKDFTQTEKAKAFKIVSISVELGGGNSLDSNIMRVRRKMEELKMDWDNVYEQYFTGAKKGKSNRKLESNNNMLQEKLNIENFPTYIVTDFNGVILYRSNDFNAMQNFIDTISVSSD